MSKKQFIGLSLACACLILIINFGLRSSMGFFMKPIAETHGYGREIFAFSLALQNLFWGLFQPMAGMVADKYGSVKTVTIGAVLYALGLYITSIASSPMMLHSGAGLLLGMGIAGTGFGVVLPAMTGVTRKKITGLGVRDGSRFSWSVFTDTGCKRVYSCLRLAECTGHYGHWRPGNDTV